MMSEVYRLRQAEMDGKLFTRGNWELGQAVNHLSQWIQYSFTGAPIKAPWYMKFFMQLMKNRILKSGFPAGVKMPGVEGGTLATENVPSPESIPQLAAMAKRLQAQCPALPNPVFGPLTHEQWKALHLRHAELHLSFMEVK
jgi:hypothetical protein